MFHATRVLPNTDFAEGLLPLPTAVPRLIKSLENIGLLPASATARSFHRDIVKIEFLDLDDSLFE